jgi:PAS domain S-box-containing protein
VIPILVDKRVSELLLISRDVTDRIEQEKALRESEATLRGLFVNVPDLIRVLTPSGIIKFANHTYWDIEPDELVGRSILEFVAPEQREEARAWIEKVVRTGEPSTAEQQGARTGKMFMTRLVPILNDDGEVEELLMVGTDVTEQRAHQDALRKTRDEFQFLAEQMNDIIWQADANMHLQYISP